MQVNISEHYYNTMTNWVHSNAWLFNYKHFRHSTTKHNAKLGDIINYWNEESRHLLGFYREKGDTANKFIDCAHILFIDCSKVYMKWSNHKKYILQTFDSMYMSINYTLTAIYIVMPLTTMT